MYTEKPKRKIKGDEIPAENGFRNLLIAVAVLVVLFALILSTVVAYPLEPFIGP